MGMILKGDCIEVMKAMKPNSVDAIVTDPPYGLEFMGKEWDKLYDRTEWQDNPDLESENFNIKGRKENPISCIFKGKKNIPMNGGFSMQFWHTQWLTEAYQVLKPGASMLVMGGTRTSHRLACAIEDSGFIIKDTLMFLYGSGFPKAQDLGKMIDKRMGKERKEVGIDKDFLKRNPKDNTDGIYESGLKDGIEGATITIPSTDLAKHWDGFKVGGIKPAYEPIIWAVKPPEGSYVDNVLKYGVGAVNVDECRIGTNGATKRSHQSEFQNEGIKGKVHATRGYRTGHEVIELNKGRFPANVILDEEAGRLLDEQSGNLQSGENPKRRGSAVFKNCYGEFQGQENCLDHYSRGANSGGASRFFYCAKASRGERNAGLEGMEKKECFNLGHKDNPGRNAPKKSYPRQNNHPTVKPIKLFEWLIKLVTREGQIILDPFIGSGTTAIAAHNTGRKCVGIEKEDEYLEIAKRRIAHWENQPKQMEMGV